MYLNFHLHVINKTYLKNRLTYGSKNEYSYEYKNLAKNINSTISIQFNTVICTPPYKLPH